MRGKELQFSLISSRAAFIMPVSMIIGASDIFACSVPVVPLQGYVATQGPPAYADFYLFHLSYNHTIYAIKHRDL